VNVSLSGNNSKRGSSSSSARGSSFPSQDKRRKVIIDEGNKGGPKKFSVPRSKPDLLDKVQLAQEPMINN
jgi:hypothetical protein